MTQRLCIGLLALVMAAGAASPAAAANKEHQQLMADLRMLQEQSQLLQTLLATLNEALKTAEPIQFPSNIELVKKYYEKIDAALS